MLDYPAFEEHLLGQVLRSPGIIDEHLITLNLFNDPFRRNVFSAVMAGREKSPSPDELIVLEELKKAGHGDDYLRLSGIVRHSAGNARFYVDKLRERRQRADIIKSLSVALDAAKDENKTGIELADIAETAITQALREAGDDPSPLIKDRAIKCYDEIKERVNQAREGRKNNIDFGLSSLDEFCGDIRPGEVICIAARPGCGKTALALQLAAHVAGDLGKHTVVFSLEMYAQEVQERLLSLVNVATVGNLRSGHLSDSQLENVRTACIMFEGFNMAIYDKEHTLALLRSRIRREKAVHDAKLVIVDYLGLVNIGESSKIARWERMGELSKALKILAQETGVVMVECVQLNREADGKEPSIGQLRDSGSIEQDSDRIILLHPKCDVDGQGVRQIAAIVAKNRHGSTGEAVLEFMGSHVRFADEKKVHAPLPNPVKENAERWDSLTGSK